MDNKEQITTRTYKIKAIVIGILAVMVYIASQYVMFCNLPILESTGERVETDFLKWVINRNIGCIVLGIILMLIPYEWLADKFIKSHEKKLKKSASYRSCTIIGAGILLPIVAILLAIAIPTGHPDTAIICCAGSVIALGVFIFPLFENKINYQGYLALVGFISMALVYVLTLYQKPEYTNDFYRFQMPEDRLQYLFILFIFLSIIIAAFVQCITKKEGSLKYNILVFIWIAIIAIVCWGIVFNLFGMAGEDGFTLKLHSLYMQYVDSGMSGFHSSSFMILLGMLAVNIVFSAVAVKCTSKYSTGRADILRWVTIMFGMLTVWQIGVGCTKPYDRCDSLIADHTYALLLFILLRAMIIPRKTEPEIACDFDPGEDVNIWNMKESIDILEVDTQSLNEKTDLLINYIRMLEIRIRKLEIECNQEESSVNKESAEEEIKAIEELLHKSEEAGRPTEYQQFRVKAEDINDRRRKKFREVMGIVKKRSDE